MLIKKLTLGPFAVNCYILWCEQTRKAVIIDPGAEAERILAIIEQKKLETIALVNTHCHIDHVGAIETIRAATRSPFYIHQADEMLLKMVAQQAIMFGLPPFQVNKPDSYLKEGDCLEFGSEKLTVLETPGHSPGGISFASDGVVFVGDLLFAGSVGRTDLFGGSFEVLLHSIEKKIVPLGEETVVYCGHGPETTIGYELRSNPFLKDYFTTPRSG
ncbi:MBL fold metallo-hydrolase [bacterium]|nr:MBL fold metallo-hydrolase [bacterium]